MMRPVVLFKLLSTMLFLVPAITWAESLDALLGKVMAGDHRDSGFVERDQYRHPRQTLKFFGIQPDMTVVEIWPSRGWYTEILAPLLRDEGILYEAGFALSLEDVPEWRRQIQMDFADKLAANPEVYDHVVVTELSVPGRTTIAPPGSVDMILTFRNVHNWMKGNYAEAMLKVFYRTLRPGGVLGIVEHRAKPGTTIEDMVKTGYVTQEFVIALTSAVGFEYVGSSEINANPKDTKDHPEGVWTLPPTLRLCQKLDEGAKRAACVDKYMTIGESDRMTLRFRKPGNL